MMECPDLFPLGDKWVLLASLYKTNQWWVGSLTGDPPRFTPEQVGVLDYGNGYAAKTGSAWVQSGTARRLVFGFTGWQEPTMPRGCGRALVLPRELRLQGSELQLQPIPEAAVLRTGPVVRSSGDDAPLAAGSQVEIRLQCAWGAAAGPPSRGVTGIRTLASADSAHYTELGYDWHAHAFYADHSKCCNASNTIVQRAPLPLAMLGPVLNLTLYVDGGLLEAFLAGRVITPLVAPDVAAGGPPDARVSSIVNTAPGVSCSAESWRLAY
jgi:beta-fructofuranosidase